MDGRIMGENLTRMGRDAAWLMQELDFKGYKSPREILLAIYHTEDNEIKVYPYRELT